MVAIACIQSQFTASRAQNIEHAVQLVNQACTQGAQIILLPELFERPYFCKTQLPEHLQFAEPLADNLAIAQMQKIAADKKVVLPISFYEREGQACFNSVAIIDADGSLLGVYRKSHIPDGLGYQEKFYFTPGNTGFKVWQTQYAKIGVGICWDQWFPETARCMALMGAEVLFYPTAIGSEPPTPNYSSAQHWQTVMCGHAGANIMPLIAANRVGTEQQNDALGNPVTVDFYGESFIADQHGQKLAEAGNADNTVMVQEFDLTAIAKTRLEWGVFRDRRPALYNSLLQH